MNPLTRTITMAVLGTLVVLEAPARADGRAKAADETHEARVLFLRGVEAQKEGKHQEARALLLEAFGKKRHYQIAANLGSSEIELGMHREAAEHLAFAVDDIKSDRQAPPEDVAAIAELLRKAQEKIVTVNLTVELLGQKRTDARVTVDGQPAAYSSGMVFARPGSSKLRASVPAADSGEVEVNGSAGRNTTLTLVLFPSGAGRAVRGSGAAAGADKPTWPQWVGLALTIGATGAGIAELVSASIRNKKADELDATVAQKSGAPAAASCAAYGDAIAADCEEWRRHRRIRDGANIAGGALLVGAAGAAIFTAAYWARPMRQVSAGYLPGGGVVTVTGSF
jgi:hypothetical protein